jgi:hypothetical protein
LVNDRVARNGRGRRREVAMVGDAGETPRFEELQQENEQLRAELDRMRRYKAVGGYAARAASWAVVLLLVGPRLVTSFKALFESAADPARRKDVPGHAAEVVAALIRRGTVLAVLGALLSLLAPAVVLWQNVLMAQQNQVMSRQLAASLAIEDRQRAVAIREQAEQQRRDELQQRQIDALQALVELQRALLENSQSQQRKQEIAVLWRQLTEGQPGSQSIKVGDVTYSPFRSPASAEQRFAAFRDLRNKGVKEFTNCDFSSVTFSDGWVYTDLDFTGSSFYGARFELGGFRGCKFTRCDLRKVAEDISPCLG